MTPVEMPKANENLTEATLNMWRVKEGDRVERDSELCEIITDKATFQMPSPCAGTVLKLLAPEHSVLPVGYAMCVLGEPNETVPADLDSKNNDLLAAHRLAATSIAPTTSAGGAAPAAPVAGAGVRATPAARRMAKEAGIDLAAVVTALTLTAPVNENDIRKYLESKK
jgi:pyruvate dehydrogenase E2 component (dihydrolipoamide acetyltransferase)